MDPNQPTPNQAPSDQPQQPAGTLPTPVEQSVPTAPQQAPVYPTPPTEYAQAAPQTYDPNYLDSIAPPPPRGKFLSGGFGKIIIGLGIALILVVSIVIVASSGGKSKAADLIQLSVRMENMQKTEKTVQKNLRSSSLSTNNSNFDLWLTSNQASATQLLKDGGIKKTTYDKKMVASEKSLATALDAKFEDARLNAVLNRVYASTMASETQKIIVMLNTMAKKSQSSKIRDFAKSASDNLTPIQKAFESFDDNNIGN